MTVKKGWDQSGTAMEIVAVANAIKRNMPWFWHGEIISLTGMQIWVLGYIAQAHGEGEVLQRDIENAFDITRATASGILKRLERGGFITRKTSKTDGRQKCLTMTPQTLQLYAALCDTVAEVDKKMLGNISPEEIEVFMRVLGKIHQNLGTLSSENT